MRVVADTGVFSAALARHRRPQFERLVTLLAGHQLFLSAATVAELRYGAIVAEWGLPVVLNLSARSAERQSCR